jgi:hypothetical protein
MPIHPRSRRTVVAWSLPLAAVGLLALPRGASALEGNFVAGYGIVGANQYDQGVLYGAGAASVGGFHIADFLCLGGVGLAFRGGDGVEMGLGLPLATFHSRFLVIQTGLGVQRYNFQKGFLYLGIGVSLGPKRAHLK